MVLAILIVIATFFLFSKPILAVTVTISNLPSSITDSAFTFNVSVSGATSGTNYLRMDLYKDGTTNYFGETYNGSSWYNGSDGKQFLPITVISGQTWNGSVQGRIGNPSSGEYPGSGTYKIKIRRYTSSGNLSSGDTQTPQDVQINYSAPSPTPTTSSTNSSFSISSVPSEISSTDTFKASIDLNLSDSPNSLFYLKGAFKKSSTSNYFGLTKVNSAWVKNGNTYSDQYSITTDSVGKWSGSLEVEPDILDSGYDGTGDYVFKVGRYTSTGSGPTWSNEVTLKINAKEVEASDTVTNLSGLGSSKSKAVLGEKEEKLEDLPDSVYSLENYRKLSTPSGVNLSTLSAEVKPKNKFNFLPVIAGSILILGGGGTFAYLFFKGRSI